MEGALIQVSSQPGAAPAGDLRHHLLRRPRGMSAGVRVGYVSPSRRGTPRAHHVRTDADKKRALCSVCIASRVDACAPQFSHRGGPPSDTTRRVKRPKQHFSCGGGGHGPTPAQPVLRSAWSPAFFCIGFRGDHPFLRGARRHVGDRVSAANEGTRRVALQGTRRAGDGAHRHASELRSTSLAGGRSG